ncbi:uncharacterized protein EV420DRAFT_246203 [Desarmillaria tabescens]|uniref:Uncharacterized protein n=1 Tax=Armillaria tabescens TaxID=1929756 RepID=A0AA39N6T1_ARMTA|nr:uncharacterized protein EV420DRAFT_246203 [Desarmillaria tabescens]KAK0460007.1 hypothetical protein EV420DRAFT_246203 [Desarmillaria tabescens]
MTLTAKLEGVATSARLDLAHLQEQKGVLESSIQDQKTLLEKTLQNQKELLEKTLRDHSSHLERSLQEQRASYESKLQEQKNISEKIAADQQALFDRNLEDQKAAFDTTVKHLHDQKLSLDNSFAGLQADMKAQQEAATALKIDVARLEERCEQQIKSEAQKLQAANTERHEALKLAQQKQSMLDSLASECETAKKDAQKARSELERGLREAKTLTNQTQELQEELEYLRDREMTMPKRYEAGKLSDVEKSFVQSVIQMYRATCEQDIVNKENDLRSRDNMIVSLQSKIASLESNLAKCLKESGTKSMMDLNVWMSSPLTQQPEDEILPQSAARTPDPVSPTPFATLAADDDDDIFEEEKQPSALGKRDRPHSPMTKSDDNQRPARRPKSSAPRKILGADKKASEPTTKIKPRKRR